MAVSIGTAVKLSCGCKGYVRRIDYAIGEADVVSFEEGNEAACRGTLGSSCAFLLGQLKVDDQLAAALAEEFR